MNDRYTEFDNFAEAYSRGGLTIFGAASFGDAMQCADADLGKLSKDGRQSPTRVLQEITDNVQHFNKNVSTLERRTRLINTAQDNSKLRQEIIQLVTDTVQLAKIADTSIKRLKQQSRMLSQSEKFQLERLINTFSNSVATFQSIQQSTTHLEQEMLSKARSQSVMSRQSVDSLPESQREKAPLTAHDSALQAQRFAEMEQDTAIVEQREREMRQLEHDIVDINDIFRDLGTMVHDQGEVIDHIEANVESTSVRVTEGNKQLEKAVRHKRCSRKLTCVIVGILIGVLVTLIIVVLIIVGIVTKGFGKN